MTFKMLLKKKLIELGYPVEVSEYHTHGRIADIRRKDILKDGIEIKRDRVSQYKPSLGIERYFEYTIIKTNGYIENDKIKNIVATLLEEYHLDWNIIRASIQIFDANGNYIFYKDKFAKKEKLVLTEYEQEKICNG